MTLIRNNLLSLFGRILQIEFSNIDIKKLIDIRESLNTEEILDKNKTRYLKLEIREAHQEGFMYWTCQKKIDY